ncbi:outer membrane beta-barrel protein [Hymenobacter roseosalivarius]|uniref:outer membrane beta-barrel protein n=1 Tax=Hymenobacter roseosalivarius TaxID=89967 RepID=UPI001F28158A|nr:outer membrane beta-barrel protein [Hymenobacter roseosalivarius]
MLILLLLMTSQPGQAQTGPGLSSVSGRVQSAVGGKPIQFANVTLHRAEDSSAVKTEFSDAQGAFRLEQQAGGAFLVSVTQLGFTSYWSPAFELTAGGQNLPDITLRATASTQLKEVTVTGQKPLYERLADRTVVNVEGSTLASGNTTLDVLSRAPGVTVDSNDNLVLRGRQGLLVLIDGKRQPMTGPELADYLRALPAEQLASIELITNPPAKYDAQGGAGVIAINLKKDQRLGTNGSVNASYGRGEYGKFTSGLTLNHRRKDLNAFGSYTYTNREGFERLALQREFYQNRLLQGSSNQDNYLRNQPQSHTWRAGLDYTLSKRSLLGAVVNGVALRNPSSATNTVRLFDARNQPQTSFRATNDRVLSRPSVAANLNFKHSFADSSGSPMLNLDADYSRYGTERSQVLTTFFDQEPGRAPTLLSGTQNGELTIQSLKADYTRQLPRQVRLEAGAKATLVYSDNDIMFVDVVEGIVTPNLNLTNRFRYDENINAAYVTLTHTTPKLTLSVGLRGEQTNVEGRQEIGNDTFDRNYFQLFPSAKIERTLSDKHTVGLALGRRINRPTYNQLNPFRSFVDATSYKAGNPNLRPETSYNLDLTHTFDQKHIIGLSYARTERVIINVVRPDLANDRLVLNQDVNLRAQHYYALTLTAPLEPLKGLSVYNNAVIYYAYFVGNQFGTALSRGRLACLLSSNSTLTLPQGWTAELSTSYQSRERYGFQDLRAFGQVTAGVQKSLWTQKASLRFNVADIFYTTPQRVTAIYDNFAETFRSAQDSRVATLAFTYRFGNDKLAPIRRRQSGAEDEKRRAQ